MIKKTRTNYFFIKLQEEKYIDDLQKNGHLYCNHITYFRNQKENEINDIYEGYTIVENPELSIINIGNDIFHPKNLKFYEDNKEACLLGNIFSLYSIYDVEYSENVTPFHNLSDNIKKLTSNTTYDYSLFINDGEEFLNRVKNTMNKINQSYEADYIRNYYNSYKNNYNLTPFHKDEKFKNQKEYRIWVKTNKIEPFSLYIGDISDISFKLPIDTIINNQLAYKFLKNE